LPPKIICLLGSPRRQGNAELLLDKAIVGANAAGAETEKLRIADINPAPCIACGGCDRTGECVVRDDMQQIYPKLIAADGLIVSTPVFFMGLPGKIKGLVDRCQALWVRKYRLSPDPNARPPGPRRRGLLIAVGGTNFPHTFDGLKLEVKSFFHCLDIKYTRELLLPGIDEPGEIAHHPEALAAAGRAGEELARTLLEERK
jgi:multimeric flavodoxin WrbA